MSIVNKVSAYLDKEHIHYQLLKHAPSHSSLSSAISCSVSTEQVVKGVMLEDHQGKKLMAILPSSHKINLIVLNEALNRQFHLMKEAAVYELFEDCEHGAVPPIAEAYGIERIYEQLLTQQPQLYLEAGDHRSLIALTQDEFRQLIQGAKPLKFTHRVFH